VKGDVNAFGVAAQGFSIQQHHITLCHPVAFHGNDSVQGDPASFDEFIRFSS
jgi:hypothetical protein